MDPRNTAQILKYLRKTGVGFTEKLHPDNDIPTVDEGTTELDSSEELDVGEFE